jgi:hypothetical protein
MLIAVGFDFAPTLAKFIPELRYLSPVIPFMLLAGHGVRHLAADFSSEGPTHAAFRSNDFTNPPTYDFTSICSIFSDTTSTGSSRTGGKCSRSMCARRLL